MGLDMYLYKKTYVRNKQFEVTVTKGGKPYLINPERISYVTEKVAYWRKFNALHNWFVENCQSGVDDCRETYVNREKLEELLVTLHQVKNIFETIPIKKVKVKNGWSKDEDSFVEIEEIENSEKLEELFPISSGFFFGGTKYDQYYIGQVIETIEILTDLLKEDDTDEYSYQSSW